MCLQTETIQNMYPHFSKTCYNYSINTPTLVNAESVLFSNQRKKAFIGIWALKRENLSSDRVSSQVRHKPVCSATENSWITETLHVAS